MQTRKPYILTVLRSGGEYKPEHVTRLRKQLGDQAELVCLSDVYLGDVHAEPLRYSWPSWWCKMEMFAPWIKGDFLFMDLDTSIVGDISDLLNCARSTVLRDFYQPSLIGSGLMFWKEEDRAQVWDAFIADPERHIKECTTRAKWGDQGFLQQFADKLQLWQDNTSKVVSYKVHCQGGVPHGASIVCFHGKPRPWNVGIRAKGFI